MGARTLPHIPSRCSERPGFPGTLPDLLQDVSTLTAPSPILKTEALTVRFGGLAALTSVTLSVPAGQIRGVICPHRARKSPLFNRPTRGARPTSRPVLFHGEGNAGLPPPTSLPEGTPP